MALAMGRHARLGADSPLANLPDVVLQMIAAESEVMLHVPMAPARPGAGGSLCARLRCLALRDGAYGVGLIVDELAPLLEVANDATDAELLWRKPGERRAPAAGDVALALSEVRLVHDGGGEQRPTSTRSDVSIGSMCSAFTSLSSSASGSQLNSPRGAARTLTTSASMPAGTFPKRHHRRLN